MQLLEWSQSHAVFVPEVDEGHREIFESISALKQALGTGASQVETGKLVERLTAALNDHFAHEERLMRASRYESYDWHKRSHISARKRVRQYIDRIAENEPGAEEQLVEYVDGWLHDHTRLADMMFGSFLRNHRLGVSKVVFRAGTRPMDSCEWVDSRGEKFDPSRD